VSNGNEPRGCTPAVETNVSRACDSGLASGASGMKSRFSIIDPG
jgi:hypothetical protein